MADYGEGGVESKSSNIAELRKQVLSLVTRKFEGTVEKPIDDVVSGVLMKRRKKWRRRHNLPSEVTSRPPEPALRDEKEQLTDQYYEAGERLLICRRSSYALARQLERGKRELQLQAAERYHQGASTQQPLEQRSHEPPASAVTHDVSSIFKDLQMALSQVEALVKVQKMKLSMTPRLPPLHRRESLDTTNEQFGMSLLVPPQEVMQSTKTGSEAGVGGTSNTHPVLSKLLSSPPHTTGTGCEEMGMEVSTKEDLEIPSTNGVQEHINLNPGVELSPVNREQDDTSDGLPRIACVMSLMEGQDTASVVEVLAENDMVIETHSSLGLEEDPAEDSQQDSMLDERLITENVLPLLPEKEEIVSTTPDNDEEISNDTATSVDVNHVAANTDNLKDSTNHITADEELVEMIMKDSELAAWIAKARLRPRTPISYSQTRKHRSRSRSSSVHD